MLLGTRQECQIFPIITRIACDRSWHPTLHYYSSRILLRVLCFCQNGLVMYVLHAIKIFRALMFGKRGANSLSQLSNLHLQLACTVYNSVRLLLSLWNWKKRADNCCFWSEIGKKLLGWWPHENFFVHSKRNMEKIPLSADLLREQSARQKSSPLPSVPRIRPALTHAAARCRRRAGASVALSRAAALRRFVSLREKRSWKTTRKLLTTPDYCLRIRCLSVRC